MTFVNDSTVDFIRRVQNHLQMQTPLFKEIERHLEYQGYTVVYEDGILKTDHTTKPRFWVHPSLHGALFMALFALGPGAKADRNLLFDFLNKSNIASEIARFAANENSLVISAWYPSVYEKRAFSEFFDQFLAEMNAPPSRHSDYVQKLFWDNSASSIPGLE